MFFVFFFKTDGDHTAQNLSTRRQISTQMLILNYENGLSVLFKYLQFFLL